MLNKKITAEFETVDMSERAARRVRDVFANIERIDITMQKKNKNEVYGTDGHATNVVSAISNDYLYGVEPNFRRKSNVVIYIKGNNSREIESKLVNLGGLNIYSEIYTDADVKNKKI